MGRNWVELLTPPIIPRLYRRLTGEKDDSPNASGIRQFDLRQLFPGIETASAEIAYGQFVGGPGQLPLTEAVTLGLLCRHLRPRRIFEVGTFKGLSTLTMAMNTPEDTEIFTLDLDPAHRQDVVFLTENGDITGLPFTVGEFFQGTSFETKIRQLYGDSVLFDFSPFVGGVDLVFIDGNHAYENVRSDSQNALRMVRSGGVVLWDDYHPACGPGVMRLLDELSRPMEILSIAGTRFALYVERSPHP
jgi:predicted O-methyltransferase YrrM